MPFSLKHIKKWNALEIKQNGKNTSSNYSSYMQFMDSIPNKVAVDDYTWLIPDSYIDDWMSRFSYITTMTQTLGSIKGNEEPIMPDISYEPKHLDKLKLTPYPFQHIGIAYLVSVKAGIIGDEMGLGKAQSLDSKIMTPNGWKAMGDMQTGDKVIGADGKAHNVLGVYPQGEKDIYKITFSDGSFTESCDEHLWAINTTTRRYRGNPYLIKELKDFKDDLKLQSGNNKYFIPMVRPVEFKEKDLPIDPYLLGYLIGNGAFTSASTPHVTIPNKEEVVLLEGFLPEDIKLNPTTNNDDCIDYRIVMKQTGWTQNTFKQKLQRLNLFGKYSYEKHIPDEYKIASVHQREALLQGLLDSDGHVRPKDNNIEFSSSSKELAQDVSELVQSLGGVAKVREKETTHRRAYRMSIAVPEKIKPFRIERKASVYSPRVKYPPSRAIVSVEYVGQKEAQCIYIDSEDHLYVTDDYILTHNTIQGIGASHELIQEGKIKKVVVVPPASLKYQWAEEIKKFTDYTSIVVDGTKKQRTNQYAQFSRESVQFLIVGYETIRNDIDMVKELEFDCICLDEAQKIKNRQTKTYKAITQLNPEYKFLLTGTPMQNRPDEIHALMSWLDQDVLGKITQFRKKHVVTGEKFGRRFMDLGYKNLDEIRERISPRLLRRMKQEVAPDLPDMLYSIVRADMTKPQKELYDAVATDFKFLQEELQEFYANQSEQDAAQFKKSKDEDKVLGYMYMLQAIADHPLLLARGKSKMAQKYLPLVRKARNSPKLDELIETLTPQIEAGEDIVIFSRFVTMLELIHKEIMKHFNQEPYVIHGGVKPKARQEQVNDFKENPTRQIMLLSDAGNSGLNLENASSLIHYDMPWTASTFDQRSNRIHRLNSEFESVNIISMVLNDSIDEQVMRTIEHKRNLSDGLIERNQSEQDIMKQLLEDLK